MAMVTTLAVLLTGVLVAALLMLVASVRSSRSNDPIDPEAATHWLVERVGSRPGLQRMLGHVDRRVAGGVAVAVAFAVVFAGALFIGWVFDTVDSGRGFARWDQSVAAWGPDHADGAAATLMKWITELGGTTLLFIVMAVVGIIDWRRRRNASGAWFLATVGIGVVAINNGLKLLIMRERPPVEHLVGSSGSSFPSGHSSAAAAGWLAIALVVGGWLPRRARLWCGALAIGIAGLVAASRAMLGVHWLTDVLAGLVVGWAWFVVVTIAYGGRHQRLGEPIEEIVAAPADGAQHTMDGAGHG